MRPNATPYDDCWVSAGRGNGGGAVQLTSIAVRGITHADTSALSSLAQACCKYRTSMTCSSAVDPAEDDARHLDVGLAGDLRPHHQLARVLRREHLLHLPRNGHLPVQVDAVLAGRQRQRRGESESDRRRGSSGSQNACGEIGG